MWLTADAGLAVRIVKGKEDAPVQGWASGPWRAIPTVIYQKSGKGVVTFLFVLAPSAPGAPPSVRSVEQTAALAARIVFANGHSLELSPPGREITLARKTAEDSR
jgi:hypothetical protein